MGRFAGHGRKQVRGERNAIYAGYRSGSPNLEPTGSVAHSAEGIHVTNRPYRMDGAGTKETDSEGLVVRSTGSWYDVRVGEKLIPSKVRGRMRLTDSGHTNPVIIGDRVTLRVAEDETGLITGVLPRTSVLARRAAGKKVGVTHALAANVDRAWVVQSVDMPRFNPGFVDRFLVMAGVHGIQAGIVVNKIDLYDKRTKAPVRFWNKLYRSLGYEVFETSAETGKGVRKFRKALSGHISVIAGPSGVGKSSLLNAVDPNLSIRTGEVSVRTRKGKHTTTHGELHPVAGGGYVADTPGLREFGLVDLDPAHLSHYFVEMAPVLHACRFPNCTHDHEPDCAVSDAVDAGIISGERYASYLGMLKSLHLGDKDLGR
jgi:ribosome biogenesis GTPase